MFKYNSTSLTASYIQGILRDTYIPQCVSISPSNEFLVNNYKPWIGAYLQNKHFHSPEEDSEALHWEFGKQILNLTSNYTPKQTYYSTEIHERLGDYLRVYRDYYKVDLMNFYNCYSGRLLSNATLPIRRRDTKANTSTWWEATPTEGVKVTCFPIRVGAAYRVKIYNSISGPIQVQPIFFNNNKILDIKTEESNEFLCSSFSAGYSKEFTFEASLKNLIQNFPKSCNCASAEQSVEICNCVVEGKNCSHTNCALNRVGPKVKLLMSKQKYLYLLMQVPTSSNLQISVIESTGYPTALHNTLLNLKVNYNVPFSDRLLEYLTGSVITPADPIPQNIERVQQILTTTEFQKLTGKTYQAPTPGTYGSEMRSFLYQCFFDYQDPEGNYIPDFLGYVDKDVEQLLWNCLTAETRKKTLEV